MAKQMSELRFETTQLHPSGSRVWQKICQIRKNGPQAVTADLLQASLHALQIPSKTSGLSGRRTDLVVRCREHGEGFYSRYRFVQRRYKELGLPPQDDKTILGWLRGLEAMRYGPAAWRIWEDCVEHAGSSRPVAEVDKTIAHSVIIAQIKWLQLCKMAAALGQPQADAITEALQRGSAVLQYLRESDQLDHSGRSFTLRIAKESGDPAAVHEAFASSYGLDLQYPSTWHETSQESGLRTQLDVNALNTLLQHYSDNDDLSKMISIFENATRQRESGCLPRHFFSACPGSPSYCEDETSDNTTMAAFEHAEADPNARLHAELQQCSHHRATCNITSFQLIIHAAVRKSDIAIACHYLELLLSKWQDEQTAARSVFDNWLANKLVKEQSDQDQAITAMPQFRQPSVGPATISIMQVFQLIKNRSARYAMSYLKRLGNHALVVQQMLNTELAFWTEVGSKVTSAEAGGDSVSDLHETQSDSYKFNPRLHVVLLQRAQADLSNVIEDITVLYEHRSTDQFIASLVYRLGDVKASIPQRKTVIARAQRWLAEDESKDHSRLGLARRRLLYSEGKSRFAGEQTKKRLARIGDTLASRRLRVRAALDNATEALKMARREKREEVASADAKVTSRSASIKSKSAEQGLTSSSLLSWWKKRRNEARERTSGDSHLSTSGASNSMLVL